jgi:hypothetical protein
MRWLHAPAHHFTFGNTFFITAGTLHKEPLYAKPAALDELQEQTASPSFIATVGRMKIDRVKVYDPF